ncbi:hypothetical protein Q7P37_003070 [Cladosporium fusiforme]
MPEPIAIVGTACRFPGSASSPSKLWELLREPRDVLRQFPPERLNFDNFYDSNGETHGRSDVPKKSYLLDEDIRVFDAAFFRINAKEAAGMDPQHRILLETAYEAFESAGWTLDEVKGSQTSVHVGVMTDDYYTIQASDPDTLGSHAATGLSRSILSNRVSYSFDLKGPSMTIDTACSSSLVALHLAVQGLRNGEASQALVGGTNLLLHPHWYVAESSLHMLSADSRCRMWDESANGYARGEGCGVVVLKTLSKAIQDGDHIECIIRETGVNSDGSTDGLTMPSSTAQARLIRQTYENSGLDPVKDRCQYFECHGTGTQAGDPIEARAIHDAFSTSKESAGTPYPLYCGSIKTVIGHLEGSAGLAGVIKASLAIQNGIIPPNMHFQNLNPSIEPLYSGLCVPTSALPWPDTAGAPRRASVNSFGFGGTNAHAILESHHVTDHSQSAGQNSKGLEKRQPWAGFVGPFFLSARSQTTLLDVIRDTKKHIEHDPFLNLDTFSCSLHSKRTAFPYRTVVPAVTTREELLKLLSQSIDSNSNDTGITIRATGTRSGILGVFTGQGAQAAQMGKQLLLHCPRFLDSILECQKALQGLDQGPRWSLKDELLADEAQSRVSDAEISQPLCCAIQVALIDLLRTSNVQFDAVVGHSSGEIAAAYATGLLKLEDAIAIAYYRGLTSHLAQGSNGKRGGMIAAVMSSQGARELCESPAFHGRLWLAAVNSPSSVTISGDVDAIDEVKAHFSSENVRAKILNVDRAYHSEHMQRCAEKYLDLLQRLNIQVQHPTQRYQCSWFSSVTMGTNIMEDPSAHDLDGQYWVNNLVQPVLFADAVASSITGSQVPFTIALEVGPHSALKGPTGQILKTLPHQQMPYIGCLDRDECSIKAFSAALGSVWTHLGPGRVDIAGWRQAFNLDPRKPPIKGTPAYPWDHSQILWRESRLSRNYRLKGEKQPSRTTARGLPSGKDMAEHIHAQRDAMDERPRLPGSGPFSSRRPRPVKLLEAKDVNIVRALVINENDEVEVIFKMRMKEPLKGVGSSGIMEADFEAYTSHDNKTLEKSCYGQVSIHLGHQEPKDLPLVAASDAELTPLSTERFNRALLEVGLRYDGTFRAIDNLSRTWGQARASVSWDSESLSIGSTIHPAILDTAFQVGLGTFLSQAERSMGSPFLPVTIRRVMINPSEFSNKTSRSTHLDVEASLNTLSARAANVDIAMWAPSVDKILGIQVEGLILKAITEPDPSADRNLFVKTLWREESAYGLRAPEEFPFDVEQVVRRTVAYERVALFYMRMLVEVIAPETLDAARSHHHQHLRFVDMVLQTIRNGSSSIWLPEWLGDDRESIQLLIDAHREDIDMAMLVAVGENLPAVVRGESQMIEHMIKDSLLTRLYTESLSLGVCNRYVAQMAQQVSHKHPQMKVLEIGAGTGGTTMTVLDAIGDAYSSYTCTDISASFFSGLRDRLPVGQAARVDFQVLNVETDPASQGFPVGEYDLVIAANVLHATSSLANTMKNVRALLRPGGHLIAIEVTGQMLRETGLMGGLEGWWLGAAEGRKAGPGISVVKWDSLLQATGFTGVDCAMHDHPHAHLHSCSVFATQASDDYYDMLRDPLLSADRVPAMPLVIIGGTTLPVSKLARRATKLLSRWASTVQIFESFEIAQADDVPRDCFLLCLSDLDEAFFAGDLSAQKVRNLQEMLNSTQCALWVTSGRTRENPWANMTVGIGRALSAELPHITFQFLDFESQTSVDAEVMAQYVLRLASSTSVGGDISSNVIVKEQEVLIRNGDALIPRVIQDDTANLCLNAKRRRITTTVSTNEDVELVMGSDDSLGLSQTTERSVSAREWKISVRWSTPLHDNDQQPLFLCYGHTLSRRPVLALVEVIASSIVVAKDLVQDTENHDLRKPQDLADIAAHILAYLALDRASKSGTTLVLGPDNILTQTLERTATQCGRKAVFLDVTPHASARDRNRAYIHPLATERTVRRALPTDTSSVINMTNSTMEVIKQCLPPVCSFYGVNVSSLLRDVGLGPKSVISEAHTAWSRESSAVRSTDLPIEVISIESIPSTPFKANQRLGVVLDWNRTTEIDAIVQTIQPEAVFSSDKTYFLVGMASELGQSLCQFMTRAGARYIVLASRSAREDPSWVKELRTTGVHIHVVKMDVTDRQQVRSVVAQLRRTMPTIAGVANAALVFEAGVFVNFSAENITRQLRPKVDGTVNLDREFATDDLDFFLTFGSLATVCGNPGQAMYHAGNLFMSSLIEQRRRRGQVGSILNFGLLVDVGYVARMDRTDGSDIEGTLRNLLLTPLSEAEFHHVFLQGIVSGRPDSSSGEVIMGMEPYIDDGQATARPAWVDKPLFSHMIKRLDTERAANQSSSPSSSSMEELTQRVLASSTLPEVTHAVRELFFAKLELMVQVAQASIDPAAPLSDLGLDSLNGTELRQWLIKVLKVELPLLKILGQEPLASICAFVAESCLSTRGKVSGTANLKPAPREDKVSSTRSDLFTAAGGTGLQSPDNSRIDYLDVDSAESPTSSSWVSLRRPSASTLESEQLYTPDTSMDSSTSSLQIVSHPCYGSGGATTPTSIAARPLVPRKPIRLQDRVASPPLVVSRTAPLSFAQSGIHFLDSLRQDPTTFNVTVQYDIRGWLDRGRLARGVEKTLARHDAYRTCFFASVDGEQVEQHVVMDSEFGRLEQVDSAADKAQEYCKRAFETVATRKYQLAAGETFRAVLVNHEPDWHSIVFGFHLMASDAFSFSLFLRDLNQAYQMNAVPRDHASYLDHSQQQRAEFESGGLDNQIAYWKDVLHPAPAPLPLLPLASVRSRQAQQLYTNNVVQDKLSPAKVQRIRAVARQHGVTPMQFYLGVMQVLLARLAEVEDICIGVTDSGRGDGDFANTVGHFANILPMRFEVKPSQSFASLLKNTSHTVLSAFDNSRVPFDVILEKLGIARSSEHTPLFQAAFNYRIGDILELPLGENRMTMDRYSDIKTPYDLTINVTQTAEGGHSMECITNDDLYTHAATDLFMSTYQSLITSLTSEQSTTIDKCKMFNDAQVQEAIMLGRGPKRDFGWPKTLSERLPQIISRFGNSVALQDNQEKLTYDELSQEMARLIQALRSAKVKPGSRIVCLFEPGVALYTLMLAILHIGCVYVPLDVALPTSRHLAIIDACEPQLIVFHAATAAMAEKHCEARNIDKLNISCIKQTTYVAIGAPQSEDERDSFLLFTSGSTGTPKGIRLGQAGLMNYAASKSAHLKLGQVRVLQQTSSGFDMAIAQAFNAFANGGTLVVAPLAARGDPAMISEIIRRHSIELTIATPSEYQLLCTYAADVLRDCHSWAHACSGGEAVTPRLLEGLQRLELPKLVFTNCYGPTEISCATTFQSTLLSPAAASEAALSIGKPIPNTAVHILADDGTTLLPVGIPGEICVTGRGVARGYLDTAMNDQKFIRTLAKNPQEQIPDLGWMYRTGDRGYLRTDGALVFIGRTDGGETMVKLRGLRIDLDEVANAILQAMTAGTLSNVVVTVRGDPQYLAAHVVCSTGKQLSQSKLQAILQSLELPRYMIPAMIVQLDRFPTTPNGKLDRKAIQKLDIGAGPVKAEATDSLTVPEAELRDLWVQVLGDAATLAMIGPNTDFFTTGGSSLLLIRLQNSIKERFGVSLSLQTLYQVTTLRRMAAAMHEQRVDCSGDISWEKEASIPEDMLARVGAKKYPRQPRIQPQEVLLTGATSFWDSKSSSNWSSKAIRPKQKVVIHPGSLMSPTLGLSPAKMDFLTTNVDLIIHAAVQGHCMNNYESVKSALLHSTHCLATMALPRKIPFHYISAPRVILLSGELEGGPVSMASHPPPTDGSQGVTAAKWASEQFLESLSAKALLPVVVHRHCALVGDGAPADDVPNSVVRFSVLSRKVPRFDGALGYFDIERVEKIAGSILRSVSDQNGPISHRHHSSNNRAPLSNFTQRLREAFGGEFEEVGPLEWLQAAASHKMPELLLIHLKANMEGPKPLVFPYLGT